MATESFSHPDCASILNESFVPVAVDKDERPDIDSIYMNYMQVFNATGGWPLNIFLTPELEPILGGSYWPAPGGEMMAGTAAGGGCTRACPCRGTAGSVTAGKGCAHQPVQLHPHAIDGCISV